MDKETINKVLRRQSKSKTFKKWIEMTIGQFTKKGDIENMLLFSAILNVYKGYEKESKAITELSSWKGYSGISVIQKPDSFIIRRYQKFDQDSKPHKLDCEVTKNQVNQVILAINRASRRLGVQGTNKPIKTREIAEEYCNITKMKFSGHDTPLWIRGKFSFDNFFSSRIDYIPFNLIIRLIDYYGICKYRGGYVTVLNRTKDIQTILP